MGISINYIPKNPSTLTEDQLIDLGVTSESKRNSYLMAQRLAKLLGRSRFMEIGGFEGSYYIDLMLAQCIPYEWDRSATRRVERISASLALRSQVGVLHAILQPANGHIPFCEVKDHIRDFSGKITKYNRTTKGPKILLGKFEVNCHFTDGSLGYLHCHTIVDTLNEYQFTKSWGIFAAKENLNLPIDEIRVIYNSSLHATIDYLAKYPIGIIGSGGYRPMYKPDAWGSLSNEDLLDLQEMMWNTKFIWRKRVPKEKKEGPSLKINHQPAPEVSSFNIRSPKRLKFKDWVLLWQADFERLKAHRGGAEPSNEVKIAFQRQKILAQKHSQISFGTWKPNKYFSEIGLILVRWPPK